VQGFTELEGWQREHALLLSVVIVYENHLSPSSPSTFDFELSTSFCFRSRMEKVKIIECPRDAWQGLPRPHPDGVQGGIFEGTCACGAQAH